MNIPRNDAQTIKGNVKCQLFGDTNVSSICLTKKKRTVNVKCHENIGKFCKKLSFLINSAWTLVCYNVAGSVCSWCRVGWAVNITAFKLGKCQHRAIAKSFSRDIEGLGSETLA